jgi:hypothetical protein
MKNRLVPASTLALLAIVAGCATLRPASPERDAAGRLAAGLDAYEGARYPDAFEELAWVARSCAGRELGAHATAALGSLELDPRNPNGRPGVGMQLLADLILDPYTPGWLRPVVEGTYLLGLGLGAPPGRAPQEAGGGTDADSPTSSATPREGAQPTAAVTPFAALEAEGRVHGCGPALIATGVEATLPALPGPSLRAMLGAAEADRDRWRGRTTALESELAKLRAELEEARAEVQRIRRTLRP